MSRQLVVIGVDDPSAAREMLFAAGQLAQQGKLGLDDAVILTRSADGRAHKLETTDITPVEGGVGGAFWGLLLGTLVLGPVGGLVTGAVTGGAGALLAKIVDRGISDDFLEEMERLLRPGQAALCLLTSGDADPAVLEQLEQFDGRLIWSDLPPEVAADVNEALAAGQSDHALPISPTAPPTPPTAAG